MDVTLGRALLERARRGVGADDATARAALAEVITLLDLAPDDPLRAELITRAIVAGGRLLPPLPTVRATLQAAEAWLRAPDEAGFDRYVEAATSSYPFGAGDGCHGTGGACGPGSGCRSGAGSLRSIAEEVGPGALLAALIAELAPRVGGA